MNKSGHDMLPRIILLRPQLGENIGMLARSMANFGLCELCLVAPRDGWPSESAKSAAANAGHVIDRATLAVSLDDACRDLDYLYGTSDRRDQFGLRHVAACDAALEISTQLSSRARVGIIFGPENNGLSNIELGRVDAVIYIETAPEVTSLNLSHACAVLAHQLYVARSGADESIAPEMPQNVATREIAGREMASVGDREHLARSLFDDLEGSRFYRDVQNRSALEERVGKVLRRAVVTRHDVTLLHRIFKALRFRQKS